MISENEKANRFLKATNIAFTTQAILVSAYLKNLSGEDILEVSKKIALDDEFIKNVRSERKIILGDLEEYLAKNEG